MCECEKEGMRVMPGFYTDRERRRGSGERAGGISALAIDGRWALREAREGKRNGIGGGGGRGD
jgi:hypothetical protein